MVKIRKAELKDSNLVFNLTKNVFKTYQSLFPTTPALLEGKEDVKRDIVEKEVLIAEIEGKAIGTVRYYAKNDNFYLIRLGILAEYRGAKVGSRLIAEVEDRAKDDGAKKIILYSPYSLKKIIAFYKNLGYRIEKVREDEDYDRAKLVKRI
ncbi:GNAT family N-acetyltransferase [Orenia marismortui]|uniref:GNAT family N-acetyltransferase n=1 Tax=Orenia marismortui TaxID=46469 RepID=UPI00037EF927|nr:GNAT family N-acetyltransferase [Orenia marismortui]